MQKMKIVDGSGDSASERTAGTHEGKHVSKITNRVQDDVEENMSINNTIDQSKEMKISIIALRALIFTLLKVIYVWIDDCERWVLVYIIVLHILQIPIPFLRTSVLHHDNASESKYVFDDCPWNSKKKHDSGESSTFKNVLGCILSKEYNKTKNNDIDVYEKLTRSVDHVLRHFKRHKNTNETRGMFLVCFKLFFFFLNPLVSLP